MITKKNLLFIVLFNFLLISGFIYFSTFYLLKKGTSKLSIENTALNLDFNQLRKLFKLTEEIENQIRNNPYQLNFEIENINKNFSVEDNIINFIEKNKEIKELLENLNSKNQFLKSKYNAKNFNSITNENLDNFIILTYEKSWKNIRNELIDFKNKFSTEYQNSEEMIHFFEEKMKNILTLAHDFSLIEADINLIKHQGGMINSNLQLNKEYLSSIVQLKNQISQYKVNLLKKLENNSNELNNNSIKFNENFDQFSFDIKIHMILIILFALFSSFITYLLMNNKVNHQNNYFKELSQKINSIFYTDEKVDLEDFLNIKQASIQNLIQVTSKKFETYHSIIKKLDDGNTTLQVKAEEDQKEIKKAQHEFSKIFTQYEYYKKEFDSIQDLLSTLSDIIKNSVNIDHNDAKVKIKKIIYRLKELQLEQDNLDYTRSKINFVYTKSVNQNNQIINFIKNRIYQLNLLIEQDKEISQQKFSMLQINEKESQELNQKLNQIQIQLNDLFDQMKPFLHLLKSDKKLEDPQLIKKFVIVLNNHLSAFFEAKSDILKTIQGSFLHLRELEKNHNSLLVLEHESIQNNDQKKMSFQENEHTLFELTPLLERKIPEV